MLLIEHHPIWQARQADFTAFIRYLQQDLALLQPLGAIAYGSVMRQGSLYPNLSDVDVVVYAASLTRENAQPFMEHIQAAGVPFFDKSPIFIEDHVTARIEFSLQFGQTVFDVSIFPPELAGYQKRYTNTIHDRLEVALGSMYQHAVLLFGEVPFEPLIRREFLPFYADDLRAARMQQLEERLRLNLNKLESAIRQDADDLLCQIYKTRSYLIKWLFINARVYPVDCNRYLRPQLTQLGLQQDAIDALLLKGASVEQAQRSFLATANALLAAKQP